MARKKVAKTDLEDLIRKFAKNDVIAELEKEYQNLSRQNINLALIDDNSYIKRVPLTPSSMERIKKSIEEKGLFNPLVVRPSGNHFELILGRRRFYGARQAGLKEVPVVVANVSDEETLLMLLADTRDQREMNPIEMAYIYQALKTQFAYTPSTLAQLSHQSRSQVVNLLRLLSLPDEVIEDVALGVISYGHARALVTLPEQKIIKLARTIIREHLSVREVESLVKNDNLSIASKEEQKFKIEEKSRELHLYFVSEEEKEDFIKRLKETGII